LTHQFRSLMISTQVDNKLKNKNQSKIIKIGNNLSHWISRKEKVLKSRMLLKIKLAYQRKKASNFKIHQRILVLNSYPNIIQLNKRIKESKAKRKLINCAIQLMTIFNWIQQQINRLNNQMMELNSRFQRVPKITSWRLTQSKKRL